MALTKYQAPVEVTPAYNEQVFLYLSDQIAQPNFKYIVEVTVQAVTYTYDIYARPDGFMVFDAKDVIANYMATYYDPTTQMYLGYGEVIDVNFAVTEYYSAATHDTDSWPYVAFNACLKQNDFLNYNIDEWYRGTIGLYTNDRLFMNESYLDANVDNSLTQTTDFWLTFIRGIADDLTWAIYDETNTLQASATLTLPTGVTTDIVKINLGAPQMNILSGVTMLDGWYVEAALNVGATSVCDIFLPAISEICTKYKVYRLYFLKRNGAIGYKTFEKLSEFKVNKKSNEVRLNPSAVFSDGGGGYLYGYPTDKHFNNVVSTESTYTYTLNSDWITEGQSIKLEELFDSPKVWLQEDTDGSIKAVSIKETSHTFKQIANEPLFNYMVTVEVNQTETRQRGI